MDRYVGLDAHASSCTLAVVGPSGKRLGSYVVETNARALIEVLRGVPGDRHLCLEEGTLAGWLHEVLEPLVGLDTGPERALGEGAGAADAGSEPELQSHAEARVQGSGNNGDRAGRGGRTVVPTLPEPVGRRHEAEPREADHRATDRLPQDMPLWRAERSDGP